MGLTDISPSAQGLVLLGRRADFKSSTDAMRRRLSNDLRIDVRSYDFLVEAYVGRRGRSTADASLER